jgi:putative ABC transport system permease protein
LSSVVAHLQRYPEVVAVDTIGRAVANLRAQTGENTRVTTMVVSLLAMTIAIGIVYNNARISLAQRSRDLASLRVLGFSRREISGVLLGELAVQLALGLPIGVLLGQWWAQAIAAGVNSEGMRFPCVIAAGTYVRGIATALVAGIASALWVRRRLDRLDLIEVLKTRE